jgi:hypothetical protein
MPKSRMNEINFVGIDREARRVLARFASSLLLVGKPVDTEYVPLDPRRADRQLGSLKIANQGRAPIEIGDLFSGCLVARPLAPAP